MGGDLGALVHAAREWAVWSAEVMAINEKLIAEIERCEK